MKRKSKFISCNGRENDKNRKKLIRDNVNDEKKHLKKQDNKRKKNKA